MRVLSLGGGQQSTAVYLLAATGAIPPIDHAIFADTGEEPQWVYDNLWWLGSLDVGAPISIRYLKEPGGTPIRLGDNLIRGNAGRFASIPAFVRHTGLFVGGGENAQGKGRRQCTREFKTRIVEQTIRRELLGLAPGRAHRGERITQVFGFDYDEGGRIVDLEARLAKGRLSAGDFPLWDRRWRRKDCVEYLAATWGREVLPSACTFCPLVNDGFRRLVRDRDPDGHRRACEVDAALRRPGAAASRMMDGELYIHRKMAPLAVVDLDEDDDGTFGYVRSCDGYCGH